MSIVGTAPRILDSSGRGLPVNRVLAEVEKPSGATSLLNYPDTTNAQRKQMVNIMEETPLRINKRKAPIKRRKFILPSTEEVSEEQMEAREREQEDRLDKKLRRIDYDGYNERELRLMANDYYKFKFNGPISLVNPQFRQFLERVESDKEAREFYRAENIEERNN